MAYAAFLQSGWLDPTAAEAVSDLTFVALGLIYVPLAVRTARSAHGRLKAAWTAMTIGFVCWLAGEVLWAYNDLFRPPPGCFTMRRPGLRPPSC